MALKSDHESQLVELMGENESKHMECVRLRTGKITRQLFFYKNKDLNSSILYFKVAGLLCEKHFNIAFFYHLIHIISSRDCSLGLLLEKLQKI